MGMPDLSPVPIKHHDEGDQKFSKPVVWKEIIL